jgi:hypothetical protein
MKNYILQVGMIICLLIIGVSCGETDVQPDINSKQAASQDDRDGNNARKSSGKVLPTPIAGTINGIPFTAEFQIERFTHEGNTIKDGGKLYAVGTLQKISGENLPQAVAGLPGQEIMIPVTYIPADAASSSSGRTAVTCEVLSLQLGPLDLDLLGLVVHLDQVVLDIDAESGGGNLLGNLLCAVVSLFDGAGALAAISQILNNIIDIIGVLGGA